MDSNFSLIFEIFFTAGIIQVYMRPLYRGMGIGSKPFKIALIIIKQHPYIVKINITVNLVLIPAVRLIQSFSFQKISTFHKEFFVQASYLDEDVMNLFF